MDSRDFSETAPGRLVKNEQGHLAFVPKPLPARFEWNNDLINAISKAGQLLGHLSGLGSKLPNPQRLVRMFLRREAEFSSKIEQTHARVQTMLLFEHLPNVEREVPAVREVDNNFRVLEFAFQALQRAPISLAMIRRMHQVLLDGLAGDQLTPGRTRQRQNWIGQSRRIEDARYVPPPWQEVDACLRDLVDYIRRPGDLPTIVRCAMAHYQFEAIHPFVDGNGRVGRALVLLMLHAEDVLPVPLLNPSAQLERNRRDYYDGLLAVTNRGAWAEWIEFFAVCVAQEAEESCKRLIKLDSLRDAYRSRFNTARTSALLMRLIDELFAEPAITLPKAAQLMNISGANAQRLIDKLVNGRILREVTGQRRNRVYVAQEIVDLFATANANEE